MSSGRTPHVLVVADPLLPPDAAIGTMRTLRVVRQLHAAGWAVTVLTGDPDRFRRSTPVDTALLSLIPSGVEVLRAGPLRWWDATTEALKNVARTRSATGTSTPSAGTETIASHTPRPRGMLAQVKDVIDAALSIPDGEAGWLWPAIARGAYTQLRAGPPDVIYSTAPAWTGQLVAGGLQMLMRRPWVADFRDPWARAPWRGDRYRFALGAAAVLERWVVKRADRIVFVAGGNRDDFAAHYGPSVARKFALVPNGCDPAEFDAIERPREPAGTTHVMLHAGSLYAGRTPVPVFKAVARAISIGQIARASFRLRFLGANAVATDLPGACRELGIDDVVEFLPRVPRAEGLRAMVSASSLLLLQPGHTVSVPGKVYQDLAAGRPILSMAEEGETADLVRRSGIGVSVTPDDEVALTEALVRVVQMSKSAVATPSRELYDGNAGAAVIEQLLRSVVSRPANRPMSHDR